MTAVLKFDLSPRIFAVVLLAAAAVIAGAGWFLAVVPKRNDAADLASAIAANQAKIAAVRHAEAVAHSTQAHGAAVAAALPDALAMPQIVDQLNALAGHAGVTLDTVTPAAAETGTGYIDVPLTVVVDGRYFAVEKFLQLVRDRVAVGKAKVSTSGRLFDVTSVQLDQTEPAPNVTGTLQMKAFYFSPGATTTTTTTTTPSS